MVSSHSQKIVMIFLVFSIFILYGSCLLQSPFGRGPVDLLVLYPDTLMSSGLMQMESHSSWCHLLG